MIRVLDHLTTSKVNALKEGIDLCENGFLKTHMCIGKGLFYLGFRHRRKPVRMSIWADDHCYEIRKNGTFVKSESYVYDGMIFSCIIHYTEDSILRLDVQHG